MAACCTAARALGPVLRLLLATHALVCVARGEGFDGPTADYESGPPRIEQTAEAGVLRWIWVEERMARARTGAPVRVPVFLAEGECQGPDELAVVRWPSREPVPVQYDDVRPGP